MLNTNSDRLDYRKLLAPPPEYKVEFAVGTTYSLDLETLLSVCAIVGLNVEADTEMIESPLHLLEAIRKAGSRLLIFCQGGQITMPDKPSGLLPLLENCVCEVNLKNKKSFHPKTWFVRYSADGKPNKYRVVMLSRNLTFDRSWDVALYLDSADLDESILTRNDGAGDAMRDFLEWLSGSVKLYNGELKSKRKQLAQLADNIASVEWKNIGKENMSMSFIPYGIGSLASSKLMDTYHKLFIISPFLSKSIMEKFGNQRLTDADCTLITRKSELPKLSPELLRTFATYTVKDNVVDGEERISEAGNIKRQDIHAKVYLRTKGSNSDLFIGSANASHQALFGGNVECMLALHCKQRYLNVESLKADLGLNNVDEKSCPFEQAEPKMYTAIEEDTQRQKLEEAVKEFCAARKSATVSGDETYRVEVKMKTIQSDVSFTLSPLMRNDKQPVNDTVTFVDFRLRELSEWYIITAEIDGNELGRVVKIQTTGIPDDRDSAVFSHIIKDKNAFLTYIAFLLSDDYLSAFLESLQKGKIDYSFLYMDYDIPILYERMLKAAANSPDNLREVREIIKLTGSSIVPTDFIQLYEQFEKAAKL